MEILLLDKRIPILILVITLIISRLVLPQRLAGRRRNQKQGFRRGNVHVSREFETAKLMPLL
jgi:hypothetical protein